MGYPGEHGTSGSVGTYAWGSVAGFVRVGGGLAWDGLVVDVGWVDVYGGYVRVGGGLGRKVLVIVVVWGSILKVLVAGLGVAGDGWVGDGFCWFGFGSGGIGVDGVVGCYCCWKHAVVLVLWFGKGVDDHGPYVLVCGRVCAFITHHRVPAHGVLPFWFFSPLLDLHLIYSILLRFLSLAMCTRPLLSHPVIVLGRSLFFRASLCHYIVP